MIEWLHERFEPGPVFTWLCVAFGLFLPLVWWRAHHAARRPAVRFSNVAPFLRAPRSWAARTRFIPVLLRLVAIMALLVALARPQSGGAYHDTSEGIAIQMVLDVSGSMAEPDFRLGGRVVRRLDAVKRVFEDFILGAGELPGREGDLIGTTTFAMYADTRCPLTLDHASLRDLLVETDIPGWIDGRQIRAVEEADYTALGDAIALATDDLRRAGDLATAGVPGAEPAASRVMILLTDGADNPPRFPGTEPISPIEAAEVAARLGIRIYTIGAVGTGGSSRRSPFSIFSRRAQVDEPTLREIARITDGKYFRATDAESLTTIYEEIDKLERRETGERVYRDDIDAARLALLIGLALLATEALLRNTRYRIAP